MIVVRGVLPALAVVVLVASGAWAAPVGATGGSTPDAATATAAAVEGVPTVTETTLNETVENTTDTVDDGTTNTTETIDGETTNTTDETTTVSASVDDGTVSGSLEAETTDPTVDATLNGSLAGTSGDAELAVTDSGVTASGTVDAGDSLSVAADATVDGETGLLSATTASDATEAGTSTPSGTTGGNADGGGTDSWAGGDVPAAAGGAALVGFGAAAVTLLVRRSGAAFAVVPDIAATVSRLPSPLAQARAAVRRWLPHVLAAVGYSRYDDSDPLTHETRAELYDLIEASPGTYLSELSERADVPTSTVRHHLDVLVNEGVVTTANVRGKRRYFSLGADEALAAALSDDAAAAVIDCLAESGPASVSSIADDLDRDVSTVSHHLGRLAEDGLVEREREGRSVYSDLAPEVAAALGGDGSGRQPKRA